MMNAPILHVLCRLAALAVLVLFPLAANAKPLETNNICAAAIDRAEAGQNLPRELMTAISRVESGRWNREKREILAWPWTVTNGADGQYFPTKQAAIAHVRKLQARGIRNIDVGCMQINLRYHPDAFENLEAALDPVANTRYAASLLGRLFKANRSWGEAIKRYHSATAKFNRPYYDKVVAQWNDARRDAGEKLVQTARKSGPSGIQPPQEIVERAADDPRRIAAEKHRREVIARHRAERERLRAERNAQMASFTDPHLPPVRTR